MKLLVIGSGGREHAIAKKLLESSDVTTVYAAPGNPGMKLDGIDTVEISISEHDALINFAKEHEITYTFVGQDDALAAGIVDAFQAAGLLIFGPTQAAAELEWSKDYAKSIMNRYQVPTAEHQTFSDIDEAVSYIASKSAPIVIKADGLALGKGVLVAETVQEAIDFTRDILTNNKFGKSRVIVEEFLDGEEFSLFAFVKDDKFYIMPTAQDHKRAYDGDKGPNTGGMGTVSPNPFLPEGMDEVLKKDILDPFMQGLKEDQMDYRGVVFIGLMIENNQAKVLEFNVRFGDPETQSILLRLESDLYEIMDACATYTLDQVEVKWSDDHVACLVLASGGYPGKYEKGIEIKNIDKVSDDIVVFHAGTALKDGKLVTNGGRVLNVCARGANLQEALAKVYETATIITFDGMYYRHDIGLR